MQSGWLQVPIGYFAFANTEVRGGGSRSEEVMEKAIAAARAQWANGGVRRGGVEGLARITFPNKDFYEGEFQQGLRHGPGTYTFANGNVDLCSYELDRVKGPGIRDKGSGVFWLAVGEFVTCR